MPCYSTRRLQTRPKQFQCSGFGNCHMVFARSEHLARHVRKHTGEKPFLCIVNGCSKTFSRYDNMMQHTQTHRRPSMTSLPAGSLVAVHQPSKGGRHPVARALSNHVMCDITRKPPMPGSGFGSMQDSSTLTTSPSKQHTEAKLSHGLPSPTSTPTCHLPYHEEAETSAVQGRRLSIADLCEPPAKVTLSHDEYEALQGLSQFRHTPGQDSFFDHTLRSMVLIPSPNVSPRL